MFKNLTPHAINLVNTVGREMVIQPEPVPARVSAIETYETTMLDSGMEVFTIVYGEVTNLPDPEEGVVLIVSKLVRDACPERSDLYYPTRLIRDNKGQIVGCAGLAH